MEIIYTPRAVEELAYWKRSGNKAIQIKIQKLLDAYKKIHLKALGSLNH